MTNLSQEAFEVLVKIVDLIEDNNDINDGKWSDWDDEYDILHHYFKVDEDKEEYNELSEKEKGTVQQHLEKAIDTNSSPFLGVSLI